jgi:hypothetical protein
MNTNEYLDYLYIPLPSETEMPVRSQEFLGVDAAFGCSLTYGIGVEHKESWPHLLGIFNSGAPGSSNDRIARLAIEYIDQHKPKNIFVLWTFPERREWRNSSGDLKKFNPSRVKNFDFNWHKAHVLLSNSHADNYNFDRNRLLLNCYCQIHSVNLYELAWSDLPWNGYSVGSDNQHPGADWHINAANEFKKLL